LAVATAQPMHPPKMTAGQSIRSRPPSELLAAVILIAVTLLVGSVGALATASSVTTWYVGLNKPGFCPPKAIFGPVWTTLYILMTVAAWRVWRAARGTGRARIPLVLYAAQLGLNLAWSLIFFGLRQAGFALIEIAVLLAAILAAAAAFWRVDRAAGLMMAPYAAWVVFASALNVDIWRLN